ncbi:MAG: DUF1624 domain-containing protein [Acetobacter sp.]|nr:DUF1624 domain-containing protein [Bacteroides sp.]MCM1341821.1 DUF1624 domain-containing protein [Acetobacter sp.]MCM1433987.1 DUF1624 domain-containing protein [Clostridiales bacterium]
MKKDKKRIYMLDEIRGFAIICMILHHAFLDVGDVLGFGWGYKVFNALCLVQPIFWAIFIIISGMCTRLSRNSIKRGLIVTACGAVITLVTAVIMPMLNFEKTEIYFGILHCLGVCMVITGFLMPAINKINYKAGAVVSAVLFFLFYGIDNKKMLFGLINLPEAMYQNNIFAPFGFHNSSFFSADYFPVIPWIFLFLFGAFIGKLALDEQLPVIMYKKHSKCLCLIGKNSLWIYLAHQPVIYGIFMIMQVIISASK